MDQYKVPFFWSVVVAVMVLMVVAAMDVSAVEQYQQGLRGQVLEKLSAVRGNLEAVLNARLHVIRGLVAFVKTHPGFNDQDFRAFVRELRGDLRGIRSLQLAPQAIVTHIDPLQGNEAAAGHDLLADPERRRAVQQAIDQHHFVLAGPVPLRQGGVAMIGRLPIFLPDPGNVDRERFWGLAIILVDLQPVLDDGGITDTHSDLMFALRGRDGMGAQGEVFFGEATTFSSQPVLLNVSLPNGSWQLAAVPRNGWHPPWTDRLWRWGLGSLSAVILAWLIYLLLAEPVRLRRAIAQATNRLWLQTAAMEASSTSIVITDAKGNMEWVNPAFLRETGYEKDELLGKNPNILKSGQQEETFYQDLWTTIQAGQVWNGDFINRRKDGVLYYDETSITPVLDENGQPCHFIAIKKDITERKRTEDALRASEKRFRSVTQSVKDAIVAVDEKGLITFWNQGACEIFELGEEEALDQPVVILMPERFRVAHQEGLARMDQGDGGKRIGHTMELAGVRKNGREFPIEMSLATWLSEGTRHYVAVIRDITSRKETEEKLRQYTEDLERMVQERTRQLVHAERLATLGTFSAGVAHEINNPNAYISGNVHFLKLFWELAVPVLRRHADEEKSGRLAGAMEEIATTLNGIHDGCQRITKIVDSLKGYAKGGTNEKMACQLTRLIADARNLLLHRLKRGVALEISAAEDVRILCNGQQISQVFVNLFNNALDAMEDTGMEQGKKIYVRCESLNSGILLVRVGDNGPGIPPEVAVNIFDPFYTTKGKTTGTGLGLSIVRGIIEEHGGHIELASEPSMEGGAEFRLTIPLAGFSPAVADTKEMRSNIISHRGKAGNFQ